MLNSSIIIIIYGGIIMYSLMIIIQMFLYNYNNKIYIEVEINKNERSSRKNKNIEIYWIICNITIIILITTINHIINKIGIYNIIEYNICYWLIGTGLGLYIAPFVVYGYKMIIYIVENSSLNINKENNKYNSIKKIYNSSNYNKKSIFFISDINNIMSIYRGINNVMNWLYQMLYYGVRMWLVFVLHSFSLGSFGELLSVITDNNQLLNIFYFGLLGIGVILYLIVILYLGIQIYVYISFSLSFLHSTILLLLSENVIYNKLNYSNNFLFNNKSIYLIPVSLVDLISLNIIFYVILLYSLLLILTPLLLANINKTYHIIYNNIFQ